MPYKEKERQKLAQHESYLRNKDRVVLASKEKRKRNKIWLNQQKNKPCVDCGGRFHPAAMDFHHKDKSTKTGSVSNLISLKSRQALIDEIKKCELICSNCHRVREFSLVSVV